jgi:hypothetical protein
LGVDETVEWHGECIILKVQLPPVLLYVLFILLSSIYVTARDSGWWFPTTRIIGTAVEQLDREVIKTEKFYRSKGAVAGPKHSSFDQTKGAGNSCRLLGMSASRAITVFTKQSDLKKKPSK